MYFTVFLCQALVALRTYVYLCISGVREMFMYILYCIFVLSSMCQALVALCMYVYMCKYGVRVMCYVLYCIFVSQSCKRWALVTVSLEKKSLVKIFFCVQCNVYSVNCVGLSSRFA